MTEFETFESMMMVLNLAVSASMNFVAIVFAYLVAAFVVGKSLPKAAALGTSTIYTIFLVPPFSGTLSNLQQLYEGDVFMRANYPESWVLPDEPASFLILSFLFTFPMVAGWLGSICYMHLYIRRTSSNTKETTAPS